MSQYGIIFKSKISQSYPCIKIITRSIKINRVRQHGKNTQKSENIIKKANKQLRNELNTDIIRKRIKKTKNNTKKSINENIIANNGQKEIRASQIDRIAAQAIKN